MGCIYQIFILKEIGKKALEKQQRVYVGFMDLKGYDKVNREALWWVLRIYDVGGKLLNRTKGKYLNLICVGVKGDESEGTSVQRRIC